MRTAWLTGMLLAALGAGCATTVMDSHTEAELEGAWTVTRPDGDTLAGTIEALDDGRYAFSGMQNLDGVYEVWRDKLLVKEPVHRNFATLAWQIDGPDALRVVNAPPIALVGIEYRGTTAARVK